MKMSLGSPEENSTSSNDVESSDDTSASSVSHDEVYINTKHAESSFGRMKAYFQDQQLTDITLIAGKARINAHKIVLCAASDYFSAMFINNLKESTQGEVEIKDVDEEILWNLINYCYTGKIDLHEDTVEMLLATSSLLQFTEITKACCGFLTKQLHPSNCIGIYLFADRQGCINLKNVAYSYTTDKFMEVVQNREFTCLSEQDLYNLLSLDDLNVPDEEDIFRALMTWLDYNKDNVKDVAKLLSLVRLPLLEPSFIVDHVENKSLLRNNPQCQLLIMEAMKYHLLPERRTVLQNCRTRPRKSTVGVLYAFGGMDATKCATAIEEYNYRLNVWSFAANMNSRRIQFGVATIDNKIYVMGGRDGLKTLNSVECFDLKTKLWSALPPMSTHRHGLGVAVLDKPLYVVGGHDGWSYLNTVERWDPEIRQWSFVSPMSTQRSTLGVAVLNGRLYAVGGRDGSSCLRSVEYYDPHTNKWTACGCMIKRRCSVGVGVLNGYLYAVGGYDAPATNPSALRFDCVERYDPKTDSWTLIASMSVGRDGIGIGILGDRLFAVGGYDGQNYSSLVEAYDAANNEWKQERPLRTGKAGTCLVTLKCTIKD